MAFGTLVIQMSDGSSTEYTLVQRQMVLGRSLDADIPVNDSQISRRHLLILCEEAGVRIVDVGSANGTFLGSERLQPNQPLPLSDGLTFRVGQSLVTYHAPVEGLSVPPVIQPETAEEKPLEPIIESDTRPKVPGFVPPSGYPPGKEGEVEPKEPLSPMLSLDQSSYLRYLPAIYASDDFLGRYLLIFESILKPIDQTIANLDWYFDPRTSPPEFLSWLASWLGLVLDEHWNDDQRRALIHSAVELYEMRGTKRGLKEFLRLYTGYEPEIIEPGLGKNNAKPEEIYHFIVRIKKRPDEEVDRAMLKTIIEMEKPAHAVYSIEVTS